MFTQDNFVSISELRDKTSAVVKSTQKVGKKIVLSQNKPVGVFLSVEEYNNMTKLGFQKVDASQDELRAYAKSSHGRDGIEAFKFLETLK